jgi:hypothetical protein
MEINFKYLNHEMIQHLYVKAESALKAALLKGAEWEEIKEKEKILTELAIQKHRNERPEDFGSPAETPLPRGKHTGTP